MDSELPTAKYKIGNLVSCRYTFYQYYYVWYDDEEPETTYGIIVDIDYAVWSEKIYADTDILYVVFCLDGVYRFFVEEELVLLA